MKKRLAFYAFLFLSVLALGFAAGQDDPLKQLLAKLEKFRTEFPQEKVHLHLDKPFYSIGDTIWFRSYVVSAENNLPSAKSTILYVELISEKDSIKQSLKIPVVNGTAAGDFTLADSLREGNYRIRAYTSWMRNFGEEYFFDRNVTIVNALTNQVLTDVKYTFLKTGNRENVEALITYTDFEGNPVTGKPVAYDVELDARNISRGTATTDAAGKITVRFVNNQPFILKSGRISTRIRLNEKQQVIKLIPVKSTLLNTAIQFFPEGGQLVDSLRSKVAFKATGADGTGVSVSGYITDRAGARIAELRTEHAGTGSFLITPVAGNSYTAHIQLPDGSAKQVKLPKSENAGYVLTVTPADSTGLSINVTMSSQLINKGELTVIAQQQQAVRYMAKSPAGTRALTATVPVNRFKPGIVQFTLFNGAGQPVAERLVFIRGSELAINLATNGSYGTREKVMLLFEARNDSGEPVQGNFSVAVTDFSKAAAEEMNEPSIFSDLLLSSDIKGYVEQPNYYFTAPTAEKDRHLDLLMLTQGWRRFLWKDLQADIFPSLIFQSEDGISISGRVTGKDEKPVAGGKVTLFSTAGSAVVLDTLTGTDGRFNFDHLVFADSTQFLVQARDSRGRKNVEIELDRSPEQLVTKNRNLPDLSLAITPAQFTYLKNKQNDFDEMRRAGLFRKSIILNEVKLVTAKEAAKNSSNLNGGGNADYVIKADRLAGYRSLAAALEGKYAGVMVQNGVAYLTRAMSFGRTPMYLVVDGFSSPPSSLSLINPADVETVEILKSPGNLAVYGFNGGAGVLIVTTKRGEQRFNYGKFAEGTTNYNPEGYYAAREFYSPNYGDPAMIHKTPDRRITIYWNPDIAVKADGKASLEFFTADSPGTYRAVAEGISSNGQLGRKVIYFVVK